jgi:hypothetical protein
MNAKKKPSFRNAPPEKAARKTADPNSFLDRTASWATSRLDRDSQWGWGGISCDEFWQEILPKLTSFESMFWKDIRGNGNNHFIPTNKIIHGAQKRLEELGYNDCGYLFSLHLTGIKRVWGILENGILKIIWYDPKHEIYPSLLKHT